MDINKNAALTALEQLLEEFFSASTSNSRKCEIEQQLADFKRIPRFGELCLYFINNSSSQYVTMFVLSALEILVVQQWGNIDVVYREELKTVLNYYLIEKGVTAPHFLRNKYAKLLVDIAKQEWPEQYPNFFANTLEWLKNEHCQLIGLITLRITSEEFMGHQTTLRGSRKEEITRLMQQYIPLTFELLTAILESIGAKPRHSATATPPPSPTHPSSSANPSHHLTAAAFRPDRKALNKEALLTLQHLFTWVQFAQIPPALIAAVFNFTNVSSYAQDDDDMCVLALSTLNELLYRKCSPPGTQDFFVQLYHHTVRLLRDISCPNSGRIETLGADFMEKLTELTTLLIEQHLWRLELEPGFSAMDFLSLLFQLTMQIPSAQCYLRCLSVWAAFIKQIKPQNAQKYFDVFHAVVAAVIKKMQCTYNHKQLEEINKIDVDDDNETEWQIFLKTSIELVAIIGEYAPIETFNQVLLPWNTNCDIYYSMRNSLDMSTGTFNCDKLETEKFCCVLRDFSSQTQTLARLSSLFTNQENEELSKVAQILIDNLSNKVLESALLATNARFYRLKYSDSSLRECFIDVHSELLAALTSLLTHSSDFLSGHLEHVIEVTLPTLTDGQIPSKIVHSSAHLLLALTAVAHPPALIVLPPVAQFVHVAPTLDYPSAETAYVANGAVCNVLLRPWGQIAEEDSDRRRALVGMYFEGMTREFRELGVGTEERRIGEVVGRTLPLLAYLVEFCKKFSNAAKKMLCAAIKPAIEHALVLFSTCNKYPGVNDHILVLFLNVLGVLQQQMGVEGTKRAVEVFLHVAVSEQRASNLSGLDKLLQILQFVVESPGSSSKNFLPAILELCMDSVYPIVVTQACDQPDVFSALLSLLYSILLHRWQYFYVSQVRLGYSPVCSETEATPEAPQHPEQFLSILRVFGQALLQPDINIFRLSLNALEDLNNKWKLYHKILFREHLLCEFLTVLLQVLINKSQALLTEDIQIAVYNMACVNIEAFFKTFLRQFGHSLNGIPPEQWDLLLNNFVQFHDKDMPTFIQHLQRLIDEAQHVSMCCGEASAKRIIVS